MASFFTFFKKQRLPVQSAALNFLKPRRARQNKAQHSEENVAQPLLNKEQQCRERKVVQDVDDAALQHGALWPAQELHRGHEEALQHPGRRKHWMDPTRG